MGFWERGLVGMKGGIYGELIPGLIKKVSRTDEHSQLSHAEVGRGGSGGRRGWSQHGRGATVRKLTPSHMWRIYHS